MAEREFIEKQIRNNKHKTNSLWKSIRICIPKKSASQKTYSKDTEILADKFNQFSSRRTLQQFKRKLKKILLKETMDSVT